MSVHTVSKLASTVLARCCVAALIVSALSGCVLSRTTDGSSIPPQGVEGIVVGESTRADVTRLLGPPEEVIFSNREHDPLFERVFRYEKTQTKQTAWFFIIFSYHRSDTKRDEVTVFFDGNGIVEHVGSRLDADEAEYATPF